MSHEQLPEIEHLLQFFNYNHLQLHLQRASEPFRNLAWEIANNSNNLETVVALRKLLEAKDAAVRARLIHE
jgi:hypothetical protein